MCKTIIRINEVIRRLADLGTTYHTEGGTIIRATFSESHGCMIEHRLHYSTTSIEQAAAGVAHHVLADGERLGDHWAEYQLD